MNLFAARLFGKMVSTEKFEAAMKEQQELVTRYRAVEKSPELKEYLELKEIVESSDFKNHKSTMLSRKYKDTDEGRKMTRYNELLNSARMKNYQSAKADATFQAFLKFRDSEDFAKIRDHEALAKSSELKQYERIYKSEQYRDYLRMADSPELKEFEALEAEFDRFNDHCSFYTGLHVRTGCLEQLGKTVQKRIHYLGVLAGIKAFAESFFDGIAVHRKYLGIVSLSAEVFKHRIAAVR